MPVSVRAQCERALDPFDALVCDARVPVEADVRRVRAQACAFCRCTGDDELAGGTYYDPANDFIGPFIERYTDSATGGVVEVVHWAHRQCAFWSPVR